MLVGPHATPDERAAYGEEIRKDPTNFISRPTLDLSCAPVCRTTVPPRAMLIFGPLCCTVAKHAWFRAPSVECPETGSLVVNSSQGGGGKDLWVLSS